MKKPSKFGAFFIKALTANLSKITSRARSIKATDAESGFFTDPFQIKARSVRFAKRFKKENDPYARRHMFRAWRISLRLIGAPLLVSLTFVDFLHDPEFAPTLLVLRILIASHMWFGFALMAKYSKLRKHIYPMLFSVLAFFSFFCCLILYRSGGVGSPYTPGLVAASSAFVLMFRLGRTGAVLSQVIFCVPGFFVLLWVCPPGQLFNTLVAGSFFLIMIVLAFSGHVSNEELTKLFARAHRTAKTEIERHRRSDFLKNHFPPAIRQDIEKGKLTLEKKKIVPKAVVGFADLIGSTKIGNLVDLETDWRIKEYFLSAATTRANECGMVVLNQMGDGFFFIANYADNSDWDVKLMEFYERLTIDFQQILQGMKGEIGSVQSGIRFGISRGPIMLGWIGEGGQSYYTAMGPEVNLAARLCAAAAPNEIVISSIAAYDMEKALAGRSVTSKVHSNLKGFERDVPALHVAPREITLLGSHKEDLNSYIESLLDSRDQDQDEAA